MRGGGLPGNVPARSHVGGVAEQDGARVGVLDQGGPHGRRRDGARQPGHRVDVNMWRDFPESAWKKTALRELYKFLPHNQNLSKAVERDINAEQGKTTDIQAVTIEAGALPSKAEELGERVDAARAVMDAEIKEENHDLDEIIRMTREAQSPLELSAPKNMLSKLTNQNDKKLAEKAVSDRETELNRKGK